MEFILSGQTKAEVIDQLKEKYGIGKTSIYDRMALLGISIEKEGGISGISEENLGKLDRLHQWVSDGNSVDEFPERVQETGIVHRGSEGIAQHETHINLNDVPPPADDFTELVLAAQRKAAGLLIAQNYLTQQMVDNPELLPNELRQQVKASERVIAPKLTATDYANQFIGMMKQETAQPMPAL